jgi:hypothetical protein
VHRVGAPIRCSSRLPYQIFQRLDSEVNLAITLDFDSFLSLTQISVVKIFTNCSLIPFVIFKWGRVFTVGKFIPHFQQAVCDHWSQLLLPPINRGLRSNPKPFLITTVISRRRHNFSLLLAQSHFVRSLQYPT